MVLGGITGSRQAAELPRPSESSSRQRLELVLFLLVLVIFCYPALRRIMLLCHRRLTQNSFIASINSAWFTSGALLSSTRASLCTSSLSLSPAISEESQPRRSCWNTTRVEGLLSGLGDVDVTEPRDFIIAHRFSWAQFSVQSFEQRIKRRAWCESSCFLSSEVRTQL